MTALIGDAGFDRLAGAHICIFGCGGVGSYAAEAVARCGVGAITLVDADTVDASNINRQLIALHSTVGRPKVEVEKERILDINPDCKVRALQLFYDAPEDVLLAFDYIIDAIDSVPSKLLLAEQAAAAGVPLVSAMGTGNKLDPTRLQLADIAETAYCPLAKKMRTELRRRGITHLRVVYSDEAPTVRAVPPASISFVPSAAGLLLASAVIRDLLGM